jgi:hypothetical protein
LLIIFNRLLLISLSLSQSDPIKHQLRIIKKLFSMLMDSDLNNVSNSEIPVRLGTVQIRPASDKDLYSIRSSGILRLPNLEATCSRICLR